MGQAVVYVDGMTCRTGVSLATVLSRWLQWEVKITECGFIDREPTSAAEGIQVG